MSSKSGLDIVGIPTLFQGISDEKKTGILKVQGNRGERYIYFQNGNILQISSPENPSILSEGLKRHPEFDEESYEALCQEQKRTGQSMASILLEDEEDGKAMVTALCQFQISEEICELFTWQDCHSEFIKGEPDPLLFDLEVMDIEGLDCRSVMLEAARRSDEWKVILDTFNRKDIPYRKSKVSSDASKEQKIVFSKIDGFANIEDILSVVRLSPFAAMSGLKELLDNNNIDLRTGDELLKLANLDVFRGDVDKRTKLYERAIELGEKDLEVSLWLANSYELSGKKEKAAAQYKELGNIFLETKKYEDASSAFEKVTVLNQEDFEAQERLVTLLARLGAFEKYSQKITTYARWLSVQGEQKKAVLVLKEATEKYPQNLDNLDFLASLYQELGSRSDAMKAYSLLAQMQTEAENQEGAAKAYQKILNIDKDNFEVRKALGLVLGELERQAESMEQYYEMGKQIYAIGEVSQEHSEYLAFAAKSIIKNDPDDLLARQWLAEAYMVQKENAKATEQLKEILERSDENKKDFALLVDTLKNLVTLEPENFDMRFKLAETYIKIKREREAVQEYFELGVRAAESENIEKALKAFDALLSFEPSNYATHLKKAEILIEKQRTTEAIEELMLTGYLSMGADKLWQSVKAFREVLKINKNDHIVCYRELGKLYKKLDKTKESVAAFKKHVQKSVKSSDFGSALKSCENILLIDSENEWAQKAKQKLVEVLPKINEIFQEG